MIGRPGCCLVPIAASLLRAWQIIWEAAPESGPELLTTAALPFCSLKGWHKTAQGNALGKKSGTSPDRAEYQTYVAPLGLDMMPGFLFPRAFALGDCISLFGA